MLTEDFSQICKYHLDLYARSGERLFNLIEAILNAWVESVEPTIQQCPNPIDCFKHFLLGRCGSCTFELGLHNYEPAPGSIEIQSIHAPIIRTISDCPCSGSVVDFTEADNSVSRKRPREAVSIVLLNSPVSAVCRFNPRYKRKKSSFQRGFDLGKLYLSRSHRFSG